MTFVFNCQDYIYISEREQNKKESKRSIWSIAHTPTHTHTEHTGTREHHFVLFFFLIYSPEVDFVVPMPILTMHLTYPMHSFYIYLLLLMIMLMSCLCLRIFWMMMILCEKKRRTCESLYIFSLK
jgi:hypothetical protein